MTTERALVGGTDLRPGTIAGRRKLNYKVGSSDIASAQNQTSRNYESAARLKADNHQPELSNGLPNNGLNHPITGHPLFKLLAAFLRLLKRHSC